jgi:hypothetical protein
MLSEAPQMGQTIHAQQREPNTPSMLRRFEY